MSLWLRRRDLRTLLYIAIVIKFLATFEYIFIIYLLIFLLDFIVVTINLIQLLAAILIRINYLSIYLSHPYRSVRNVGAIFDSTLSMVPQVNSLCKTASYHLRNIARIRHLLSKESTEILVHAFVFSKLDYCNALLYGLPQCVIKKLQLVQNSAARLITCSRKYDHTSPLLIQLHWLPITQRNLV